MTLTRRRLIQAAGATALPALLTTPASAAAELKISHQFPGGTLTEGDFRDRLCRRFTLEVEKRSSGALKASVYPGASLIKTNAQFSALRKGALDMGLVPLSYAGGEIAETNIGLMPALVPSYEQGAMWKTAEVGKLLAKLLDEKGVMIVSWIWQAGGVASRNRQLVTPDDAKGQKVRGGSRAMDAAMTSSTSFISFKLEEIAKHLKTGRQKTYWFMLEPLMISKSIFAALPKAQQELVMTVGAELEAFGLDAARADDKNAADIYAKARAKLYDLDEPTLKKWQLIAMDTAWKDFGEKSESCAALLKAAQKLL